MSIGTGLAVAALSISVAASTPEALYTSIRRADCAPPPADLERAFQARDLGVRQCPAPEGWRLLFVASQANSWLELRRGDFRWSAEEAIVYDRPIGLLPNVGGARAVEWRRTAPGTMHALIFRVVAQDPGNPARHVSRLFVVRLGADTACVIGRVANNQAARKLADGPATCLPGFSSRPLRPPPTGRRHSCRTSARWPALPGGPYRGG